MKSNRYLTDIGRGRRREKIARSLILIILWLSAITVLVLLAVLYLPILRVRSIEVSGNTYIPADRIESVFLARITRDSNFRNLLGFRNMLVWPEKLPPEDAILLPQIDEATVVKDYAKGVIRIEVREREHEGVWCFKKALPEECFWFDHEGLVARTPGTEGSLILAVNDYARDKISFGEQVLPPNLVDNLFSVFGALRYIPVNIKEIRVENVDLEEISVPTFDGPVLLFSLRFPASNTPAAFAVLNQKSDIRKLSTIDFRVENRIYYK